MTARIVIVHTGITRNAATTSRITSEPPPNPAIGGTTVNPMTISAAPTTVKSIANGHGSGLPLETVTVIGTAVRLYRQPPRGQRPRCWTPTSWTPARLAPGCRRRRRRLVRIAGTAGRRVTTSPTRLHGSVAFTRDALAGTGELAHVRELLDRRRQRVLLAAEAGDEATAADEAAVFEPAERPLHVAPREPDRLAHREIAEHDAPSVEQHLGDRLRELLAIDVGAGAPARATNGRRRRRAAARRA